MEFVLAFLFLLVITVISAAVWRPLSRWMERKADPAADDSDRETPQAVPDPAADQKKVVKNTLIVIAILLLGGWALYNILRICGIAINIRSEGDELADIHLRQVDSEKMQARADSFLGFSGGRNSGNDKALTTRERAEGGDAEAQYRLGVHFRYGTSAEDHRQAVYWWQKAADQGHSEARRRLGECYYFGHGVEEDRKMAEYWLRKAAEQNNGHAKMMLKTFFGK